MKKTMAGCKVVSYTKDAEEKQPKNSYEDFYNCDSCEHRECFDCPKALDQTLNFHIF
jgi:hypothetical protein